jgi:IS30 family transposase
MLLLDPQSLDQLTEKVRAEQPDSSLELKRVLNLLDDKDRLLVEMALKHGLSRRQIGLILGLTPGTITRKIRRVLSRLHDPLISALADPTCRLAPDYRQLAIEHFLHRRSVAELSRQHALSRQEIRAMLEFVRGWHRGVTTIR